MSARQLIVLVIAAIAAVGALFLIRGMGGGAASPTVEAAQPIEGEQVLVAVRDIGAGAALRPGDLGVALFPTGSVSPSFVRISNQPSAQADYVGAVTRRAFVQGEPIIASAVVQPDGRGFIQPNDRVDVIMTHKFDEGGQERVDSQIVLEDVRILALGDKTAAQTSGEAPEVIDAQVAVLELTAEDARALALADEMGDISLALRGVEVDAVGMRAPRRNGAGQSSGSVRVHAYGAVAGGGR